MKGICFKEPLFLKVVDGTKTMTRRIIKNQPDSRGVRTTNVPFEDWHGKEIKPLYKIGKIIFLKEPYANIEWPGGTATIYKFDHVNNEPFEKLWKNKLFQPEKYARYFIKITDIGVERAQQITEADAILEGCKNKAEFENWWIKIHGFSSWKENPWVFVYQFENIYEL